MSRHSPSLPLQEKSSKDDEEGKNRAASGSSHVDASQVRKQHPKQRKEGLQKREEREDLLQPGVKKWKKRKIKRQSLQARDEGLEGVMAHVYSDRPQISSSMLKRCVLLLGVCCFLVIGSFAVVTSLSTSQLLATVFPRIATPQVPTRRFRKPPPRSVLRTARNWNSEQEVQRAPRPFTHPNAAGGAYFTPGLPGVLSGVAHSSALSSSSQLLQAGTRKEEEDEASRSDEQYLKKFRDSYRVLCDAGASQDGVPVAARYSTPQEPCGKRKGEIVVLNGVKMHHRASRTTLSVPTCQGREDRGWSAAIGKYTLGWSHLEIEEDIGSQNCDLTIEENTILILNPREEYFGGVFHNLEEVFALMETSEVLGREPRDFRVVLVYTRFNGSVVTLAQLPDQLGSPLAFDAGFMTPRAPHPKQLVPQLVDLYSKVAASGMNGDTKKFLRTPLPSNLPRSAQVCFKGQVILPMRACLGSVLTRTWSGLPQVYRSNNLTTRYAKHIAEDIYHCYVNHSRKKRVQILSRHSSHGRNMRSEDEMALIASLQSEFPNADVDAVDFASISMEEQICIARRTDLMIGVHGSGLTHMIYMPRGSSVLEITPYPVPSGPWSYANYPHNLARWTGHRYESLYIGHEGYYVQFDVKEVVRRAAVLLRRR